ncbi:hypothetical protein KUCAC02_019463 [Chaenocephalus aceratus]|uniref:Uncharacterized protein n=1 Tax=Chaenocephalus aceratus TaxID=36190 RepID=A0ACB9VNP1_CHAAC|nr:hypothetical protein KUCAC02_019463 [Chaenocephalus aceratus]
MWTVVVFLNLLGALHFTASSSPPSPINVTFSSVDLRNVLEWLPGSGTLDDTQFTVQYAIYGDSVEGTRQAHWRAVPRCTRIVRRRCDLSNETGDLEQGYYARVRAVSRRATWVRTTKRFDPKSDTTFGPPYDFIYPDMTYELFIEDPYHGQIHHSQVDSSLHTFRKMEYDTKYCFSARASLSSMPAQCLLSARYCITTPTDPVIGQLQRVVVGIIVPLLCMGMLVVVGYLLYNYLSGKGQKSPYILNLPTFHQPPLTFPPENPKPIIITIITIIKDQQPESGTPHSACPKNPTPGYASQRPQTPPAPEEPWDDLPVDYGCLAAAPKIEIRGGNWNDLNFPVRGSYEKKECDVEDDHPLTNVQTEMSTLIQAHAWSLPVLTPLVSGQGASMGEVKGKEEEREFPGLLISPIPQIGFFHIPLNLLAKKEGGMGEEINGNMRVGTDGEMDESEVLPLLSAYASQNTMQISHSDQSDDLPDDYGILMMNTAHNIEKEEEEEEEGNLCIDWDPQTRKLVLPEIAMGFNKEGVWDGMLQGEKARENMIGGEGEEETVNWKNGELRLENVFVRQGSEEKAEAQRVLEGGGDDFLTGWGLVISMDE